jgi:hypothetical protein
MIQDKHRKASANLLLPLLICLAVILSLCPGAGLAGGGSFGAGENLLRNASFNRSTNPPLPDYWDLHHAAATEFPNLHRQYLIDDGDPSPVPNTRTLKIVNSSKDFYHAILLPHRFFEKLPEGTYTFSVYAKADLNAAELKVYQAWDYGAPAAKRLTRSWQRVVVTFTVDEDTPNPPQPVIYLPSRACYHLAAPQLEYGSAATPFRASPRDESPAEASLAPAVGAPPFEYRQSGGFQGSGAIQARKSRRAAGSGRPLLLDGDRAPFFIIGMQVGGLPELPEWYLQDLAAHGINTLFFWAVQDREKRYDLPRIEGFLSKAAAHGFKVVLGLPLMGAKEPQWRKSVASFVELVDRLKTNPAILAWEPVDEPAAATWQDSELQEIYRQVKQADPSRPVFVNWAYDAVPVAVGAQPCGTLAASDFYSTDYYPFAGVEQRSMADFTGITLRALETARIFGKIPHSWIQLYGGMDAWREPTGDELNYLVYLNLLYGGMFSYWDTKSNSAANWSRVAELNRQAQILAGKLFLNPEAREIRLPSFAGNFGVSAWRAGNEIYLIVLHNGGKTERLDLALTDYQAAHAVAARSLFENRSVGVKKKRLEEVFLPYQCRVYVLSAKAGSRGADKEEGR